MAIEGINGNMSSQVATAQAAITPPKPEATTAPEPAKTVATPSKPYVVELTGTALAKSLKLAGQNPAQIALKMGLDIKTVDQYLSIKVATPAPATPAPTSVPAQQAKQSATTPPPPKAQGKK